MDTSVSTLESSQHYQKNMSKSIIIERVKNRPPVKNIFKDGNQAQLTWWVFILAGTLYGGMHAFAWNIKFRTPVERTLWLLSVCIIMAFGPVISLTWFSFGRKPRDNHEFDEKETPHLFWIWVCFAPPALVLYILCRAYLIVECFLALFHSPVAAFNVPAWLNYLPHIA